MELIQLNPKEHRLNDEMEKNIERLLVVCNRIEKECGYPLTVNRGYSTADEQIAVYKVLNGRRALNHLVPLKPPMGSAHMEAAAADLADPHAQLWDFLFEREALRVELGIALEARAYTPTWVHVQIYLPKSGHLIFQPY